MHPVFFPRRSDGTFAEVIADLLDVRKRMMPGHSCQFNLWNSEFLSPLLLCGSAALKRSWDDMGHPIAWRGPNNDHLRNYLKGTGVPTGFWDDETHSAHRSLVTLGAENYVPLIGFRVTSKEDEMRERLIQAIESLLGKQCNLMGQRFTALKFLMSELTNNIGQHAITGSGFIMAHYRASYECIDLAIADTGVGLRQSYLDFGFDDLSHAQAISNALDGISTKKGEQGRGFGLRKCRKMLVTGMKGEFFLWSGDACLMNNPDMAEIYSVTDGTSFPGCYLALRIPTTFDPWFKLYDYVE